MKAFTNHLRDYLELRRGLGFELERVESRLRNFIAFMETKRAPQITTALALDFAVRADHRSAATQAGCLSAIRGFAQYLSGIEVTTQIPPTGLIRRGPRPQPYIYSDDEIARVAPVSLHSGKNCAPAGFRRFAVAARGTPASQPQPAAAMACS
jgi:site-specific recombinase XerD